MTKHTTYKRSQCSWTLNFIYSTPFNTFIMNCWLINFICRYIPLKQWAFGDSHSPKYQKFKIDELPLFTDFCQDWAYRELIPYYENLMARRSAPLPAARNAIFLASMPVPAVMLRNLSFTKTTVPKGRTSLQGMQCQVLTR